MRILNSAEEAFPASWAAVPQPPPRQLQVLVGEPPVPCVRIFAMLPALNRLSDTRPGKVLTASLPCFELKALQLPLLQHCNTLRELPLRLPQKPGLARSCAMLLGRLLRTKVGRRKLEEFRFQDGFALPLLLCDGEFLLRQAVIHDVAYRIVELRPKPEGGELVPWGRRAYADLAAAAEAALPRNQ